MTKNTNITNMTWIKNAAICSYGHKAKVGRITVRTIWKKTLTSSSVRPMANATDVLQPAGLLYSPYPPLLFGRSHVCRQVPPRPRRRERS